MRRRCMSKSHSAVMDRNNNNIDTVKSCRVFHRCLFIIFLGSNKYFTEQPMDNSIQHYNGALEIYVRSRVSVSVNRYVGISIPKGQGLDQCSIHRIGVKGQTRAWLSTYKPVQ